MGSISSHGLQYKTIAWIEAEAKRKNKTKQSYTCLLFALFILLCTKRALWLFVKNQQLRKVA